MYCRITMSVAAAAALGLCLLSQGAIAQQKSLKDQLVGTWRLISFEQTRPDGSKLQRFGANPRGVQVFTADNRFFITFMRADLPKIAAGSPIKATADEAKAIVAGSLAYYGTYTVDEAGKIISYHTEASTFPNQLGLEQKRAINSLTADELKYTNPAATSGGQIQVVLERVK